jgi:membrane-bound lytic murein transglycosylase D
MSSPAQLLVYPLVLLGGVALGSGILSIHVPQQNASAATPPPKRLPSVQGRLSAESPELRELRVAESSLFPEVGSADFELSSPELWDEVLEQASKREGEARAQMLESETADVFAGLKMPSFPIRRHPRVARYIEYFTSSAKGRKLMTTWLRRAGRYESIIEGALKERNMPRELSSVVYIESGFWPTARSSAGAVGLWQFMPKTGRAYGLAIDKGLDERRSIWRATEAATQHLSDLYERLNSWDLALAAYNMGYQQLHSRMQSLGVEDFWSLSAVDGALPRETALYVPKVLAVVVILNNLERFQLQDIERMPPLKAAEIRVPPGVRLSQIARAAGTSLRTLREYNPEFRSEVVPDRGGPVSVHIPSQGLARAKTMLPRLLQDTDEKLDLQVSPEFDWGEQELDTDGNKSRLEKTLPDKKPRERSEDKDGEPGDDGGGEPTSDGETTLFVDPLSLPKPNAGSGSRPLGKLLNTPPPSSSDPAFAGDVRAKLGFGDAEEAPRPVPASQVRVRVQLGDTIWKLSEIYGTPRWRIIRDNGLNNPNVLSVGRMLVLNIPEFKNSTATPALEKSVAVSEPAVEAVKGSSDQGG